MSPVPGLIYVLIMTIGTDKPAVMAIYPDMATCERNAAETRKLDLASDPDVRFDCADATVERPIADMVRRYQKLYDARRAGEKAEDRSKDQPADSAAEDWSTGEEIPEPDAAGNGIVRIGITWRMPSRR